MNNRRFKLTILSGNFKKLNLYKGMETNFSSLVEYFDGIDTIELTKTDKGYKIIFEQDYKEDPIFFAKFVELENY